MAGDRPRAAEAPRVERQPARIAVDGRLIEPGDVLLRERVGLPIPEIALGCPERAPVGRHLEAARLHIDEVEVELRRAGVVEELLDDHLGHPVLALAEVVEADPALGIGEIDGRPEVVREGAPHAVVVVDGDRIRDAELGDLGGDIRAGPLEAELGRVHADDGQTGASVLGIPGAQVRRRAQPVDARVGPEVDQDDPSAQAVRGERFAVQPARGAVERRQATLDRQDLLVACQPVREGPKQARPAGRRGRRGVVDHRAPPRVGQRSPESRSCRRGRRPRTLRAGP